MFEGRFTQPSSSGKRGLARGLFEPLKAASLAAPSLYEQRRAVRHSRTK
jgi:hypothetical protein